MPSQVELRRPPVLAVSYALWLGAAAAGLAAVLMLLLDLDGLEAALHAIVERDYPDEDPATRDRVVSVVAAILVGSGVTVALGEAAAAVAMGSGRGWARFVLAVLLALSVVDVLLSVEVASGTSRIVLAVSVALAAVAAVLMYLPAANLWFAARRP